MWGRTLCCCTLVTVIMGMGQTSFTAAHVSPAAVMESPVSILIPAHTWPSTNTAVEDLSKLCAREPHTHLPKSLMEPVKLTGCALAASLILSSKYCWGHTMPCIPIDIGRQGKTVKLSLDCYSFCWGNESWNCSGWQITLFINDHMCTPTHTQWVHFLITFEQFYYCVGWADRKLITANAGVPKLVGFFVTKPQINAMKMSDFLW